MPQAAHILTKTGSHPMDRGQQEQPKVSPSKEHDPSPVGTSRDLSCAKAAAKRRAAPPRSAP